MTREDEWLMGMMLAQEKHSEPSISEQVDLIRRRPSAPLPVPQQSEILPYESRAEAGAELAGALFGVVKILAPPVIIMAVVVGFGWIAWTLAVASADALALAVTTWIAAHTGAVVAGVGVLAAGAIVWVTSLGGNSEEFGSKPSASRSGQNITVIVNAGDGTVTSTTK